jgi:NDP-sugar pyrophosphorylase family protein
MSKSVRVPKTVSQSTDPPIVVLAAGRGSRLGALTGRRHKLALRVGGVSVLELLLETLSHAGFAEIVVVTGYRHEQIEAIARDFGAARAQTPRIVLVHDDAPRGTLHSLRRAQDAIGGRSFIVMEGATLFSGEVLARFRRAGGDALLLTHDPDIAPMHSLAAVRDGRVVRFWRSHETPSRLPGETVGRYTGLARLGPWALAEPAPGCDDIGALLRQAVGAGETFAADWDDGGFRHLAMPRDFLTWTRTSIESERSA